MHNGHRLCRNVRLHIAAYTVQDHLSHIFDKVGVRGRRALVKRLYLDSLYPAP